MIAANHILAESDIGVKLIIGLIVGTIWAVGALANWLNKQKNQQDESQRREQIRRAIEAQRASAAAAAQHQQLQQQRARVAPRAPVRGAPPPRAVVYRAPAAVVHPAAAR